MCMRSPFVACLVCLTACSGSEHARHDADGLRLTSAETASRKPVGAVGFRRPALPAPLPEQAAAAPITYRGIDGSRLHVGKVIAPNYPMARHPDPFLEGGSTLFRATRHEQIDSRQIIDFLSEHAQGGLQTFAAPPTVHIGEAMNFRESVVRAVQWINEALPPAWHIQIGRDVAPLQQSVPSGAIYIDFASASELGARLPTGAAGAAHLYDNADGSRRASHVVVAPERVGWYGPNDDTMLEKVIIHELLHALGFSSHVERQDSRIFHATLGREDFSNMLFPIDRQALFAAYAKLKPGDRPPTIQRKLFNGWSTLGDHWAGISEFSEFGVARQFGVPGVQSPPFFLQAWASGEAPHTSLADSPLKGSAVWTGDIIGVRPDDVRDASGYERNLVTGTARIAVELGTLEGEALFDDLATWANTEVEEMWGDGDLEYDIKVRGNTFHQTATSIDDGVLTGIFTGRQHEGAAGTLERSDLTAAFGAARQ